MNESFLIEEHTGLHLLVHQPWITAGITHGMTLSELRFRGEMLESSIAHLTRMLAVTDIVLPEQCHGTEILDLRGAFDLESLYDPSGPKLLAAKADAVVAPAKQVWPGRRVAIGIMTADCVPILVRSEDTFAAIHAGWRGLADGIIAKTVAALSSDRAVTEAAVFACAGSDLYEVGQEVLDAIGDTAAYRPSSDGKFLLDLGETARNQLNALAIAAVAGECTISNPRYHSYRRDRDAAGRCVTFIVPRG